LEQLPGGLLGRIAAQHEVDIRGSDQLLVGVTRGESSKKNPARWMKAADQLREGERALRVGQPMKVDPEDRSGKTRHVSLRIKRRLPQHPIGEVDDLDVVVVAIEKGGQARQPDRI